MTRKKKKKKKKKKLRGRNESEIDKRTMAELARSIRSGAQNDETRWELEMTRRGARPARPDDDDRAREEGGSMTAELTK
ncbi:unnamed protein product [Heligmosomoides polygyrus]|uniref:Uncharacterized protein n=1 Tax=Heligmosomoides polygyrus TaxID=6339 RepID=A0A183GCN1_HELPZ|nr:unnamed protein product [Heligmosomoides polygyrus]